MKQEELIEAIKVIGSINGTLEDLNQTGEIPYVFLQTEGSYFTLEFLGKIIYSENDFLEVNTVPTAHCDGLTDFGKQLEQFVFDKMDKILKDLGKESVFIYSFSSKGRGVHQKPT